MKRLREVLENKEKNYILPFFWQHGESEEILRDYMKNIYEAGIKAVCIESRPHPDFVGPLWWRDMDIIMDEARKRGMKVWVLDDSHFPTGYAAGRIKKQHPELRKWYLNVHRMDFAGPLKDSSFIIKYFPGRAALSPGFKAEEDKILAVVAAKISDVETGEVDDKTLINVSEYVQDGVLYWDLPEGYWSIFVVYQTRRGGEETTKDYLNPLVPEATKVLIDTVYEAHFDRYKDDFGKTLAGFFSDEPRFGNLKGFNGVIGKTKMVLPWSDDMIKIMQKEVSEDILIYLPLLFTEGGEKAHLVRYAYMNVVSRMYGENFTNQLGNWCREHGVEYIGHIIEDNGAHSRLGYGTGHFFRALYGQDMSGIDVIGGQVVPGMDFKHAGFSTDGWDGEFFHYGLGKLGTSLAHIDPKKKGRTICELFGAYGWVEGLKFMKWLTDHLLVRGVNYFVPHAFSPKTFPDTDCPPHFYAGGNDAQFKHMKIWSDYTNKISHLLSEGTHVAPVAVLYHAEAEWSGKYMPFEKVVKELIQNQIDCDVVPADIFKNSVQIEDDRLVINKEKFKCLIIPYAEALPKYLLIRIAEAAQKGFKIIFIEEFPERFSEGIDTEGILSSIKDNKNCIVLALKGLGNKIKSLGFNEIALSSFEPYVTYFHYRQEDADIFMFFNEHPYNNIDTRVFIPLNKKAVYYDAFENKIENCNTNNKSNGVEIQLKLNTYESKIIIFRDDALETEVIDNAKNLKEVKEINVSGSWKVFLAKAAEYPNFNLETELKELVNLAKFDLYPNFSGIIRYEINFTAEETAEKAVLDLGRVYEVAELWLNDNNIGVKICPPYKFDITNYIKKGTNKLVVEVTNTLVKSQKDYFSQFAVQEPTGLLGPVSIKFY
ncbi:glycoside hydrolase [Clostridium sp. SYSU_GA19001]|uniref:glycosylhydrolase-like jelly roll fold domain-containing protein n=1 Tax=Clostridium caldaquaticum TaxID=2940653 RepID=UPI00207752F2|nr:glycosyl hydrolase [Clostridium caldaquaticum]MCM8711544.1 glycoside hydrolase [Clostridium caldaquaticum]